MDILLSSLSFGQLSGAYPVCGREYLEGLSGVETLKVRGGVGREELRLTLRVVEALSVLNSSLQNEM